MKTSEDLALYFVYHITQAKVGIEKRIQNAIKAIDQLVQNGWSLPEIKQQLDQFALDYPEIVLNVYHVEEIMKNKQPSNNLLEPNIFYYHNALRETSAPVRIVKDENGRLVRREEPFYLEMKKCFTLEDLLRYWYNKMNIQPNEHMIRQDEGKFKYMLNNYTVDELLFAIDVSITLRKEQQLRPLRNAFELEKYIEDARDFMQKKENTHKLHGINREVKKQVGMSYDYPYN